MASERMIPQTIMVTSIFYVVLTSKEGQCPPGRGGEFCRVQCPVRCETCTISEICQQCKGNYQEPTCRSCKKGFFGANCEAKCSGCHDCDATTGACPMCAEAGLALPDCTSKCPNGTYGMHCANRCPLVCAAACDSKSGYCLKCDHGHGKYCTVDCSKFEYSEACRLYCKATCDGMCNTTTTQCDLCAPGLKSSFCNETCLEGFHGQNCQNECPLGCKDARCDPVQGTCRECLPGLTGLTCSERQTCEPGFYGEKCSMPCPQTCAGNICQHHNGICLKCHSGYEGDMCDEPCSNGTYGQNCSQQCPQNCAGLVCSVTSGHCAQCVSGYHGDKCDVPCDNGTWGPGCSNNCSVFCTDGNCDPVTGHCKTCVGERSGNFCSLLIMKIKNRTEDDYPVGMKAVYIFLGLLTPVVVIGCPAAIYQMKVKRLFNKTKDKEYREKAIEKVIPSSELAHLPSKALPKLQVNDKDVAINETGFTMKNADMSLQSFTKSSMSKFNSNFEVTTRWTKSKASESEDVSKGTKSNSLAIDISLNERESQRSIADAHSFVDDDRSPTSKAGATSALNSNDMSTVKSFKNIVNFQQGIDQLSTSTNTSQSLSISGSYPKPDQRSDTIRKTSANIKMIATQNLANMTESPDWETSLKSRERIFSIQESTPDHLRRQRTPFIDSSHAHGTGAIDDGKILKSNIERKQSLTVVNLWKGKDYFNQKRCEKIGSFTSETDTNPLTTFLPKEMDTDSLRTVSSISRELMEHREHQSFRNLGTTSELQNDFVENYSKPEIMCKVLPTIEDDLSFQSNQQPTDTFPRSSQKLREKPLIQKMFDNVLDAMQSGSSLYQNKKNEIDVDYEATAEDHSSLEEQTDRSSLDSRHSISEKRIKLPGRNTCIDSQGVIQERDESTPRVSNKTQFSSSPSIKSLPAENSLENAHEISGPSEFKVCTENFEKIRGTSHSSISNSICKKKSTGRVKSISLHVGTSPTGSLIDEDSTEYSTRLSSNMRLSPPSKLFKILHSPVSTNISQISVGSESLSHISDDHLDTPPKLQYFHKNDKEDIRAGSPPASNFEMTRAITNSGVMITGRSPVKSKPKDKQHTSGVATSSAGSKSYSKSLPSPTFSNPMESSTIAGVAKRSDQCVPLYRDTSIVTRPGSSVANTNQINLPHEKNWMNILSIANPEATAKGPSTTNTSSTTYEFNTPTSMAFPPKNTNVIRCSTTREISPRSFQSITETKRTSNPSPSAACVKNSPESHQPHKAAVASSPLQSAENSNAGPIADAVRSMLQIQNEEAMISQNRTKRSEPEKELRNYIAVHPEFADRNSKLESQTVEPAYSGSVSLRLDEFTGVLRKTKPDTPRPGGSDNTPESDTDTMVSSWKSVSQTEKTTRSK